MNLFAQRSSGAASLQLRKMSMLCSDGLPAVPASKMPPHCLPTVPTALARSSHGSQLQLDWHYHQSQLLAAWHDASFVPLPRPSPPLPFTAKTVWACPATTTEGIYPTATRLTGTAGHGGQGRHPGRRRQRRCRHNVLRRCRDSGRKAGGWGHSTRAVLLGLRCHSVARGWVSLYCFRHSTAGAAVR